MRATMPSRRAWLLRAALAGLALLVAVPLLMSSRSAQSCWAAGERSAAPRTAITPGPEVSRLTEGVHAAVAAMGEPVDRFGVAAVDVVGGGAIVGTASNQPFYAASLAKLVVAVDLLERRAHHDGDVAELIRRMLGPSDDEAMNALWVRFDGVGAIERVAEALGLAGTTPPADPSQWGETMITAADTAKLFRHVLTELPAAQRALVVNAVTAAPATAADGFGQHFGLLTLAGEVYAKQGWMSRAPRSYLHSAGVIEGRYVFALLAETSESADPGVLAEPLNAAAGAVAAAVRDFRRAGNGNPAQIR